MPRAASLARKVELDRVRRARQQIERRPAAIGGNRFRCAAGAGGERRIFRQQALAHARPLRAIAGKGEAGANVARDRPTKNRALGLAVAAAELLQALDQLRPVGRAHDQTPLHVRPSARERVGDVPERQARVRLQVFRQIARPGRERLVVARREGDRPGGRFRRAVVGGRQAAAARGPARRAFDDDVAVQTPEPERVDADEASAGSALQRRQLARDSQIERVERDIRVEMLGVQRGRNLAVLQRQHRFQHAGHAGRRLEVADVRFDRTDRQRVAFGPALADMAADRARFGRVADGGAGAMRLEIVEFRRIDVGRRVDTAEQGALTVHAGQGDAVGPAVLVQVDGANDRADRVAVRERPGERLKRQHARPFAAHISRRAFRERPALPVF